MRPNSLIVSLTVTSILCAANPGFCETIKLKSGSTVEGKIIEKTDAYIAVDIAGVSVPYFLDEIESIDGKTASREPLKQDESRVPKVEPKSSVTTAADDHQDIFEKRLVDFMGSGKTTGSEKEKTEKTRQAGSEFLKFASEYPKSKFAPDAQFLYYFILFQSAIRQKKTDSAVKLKSAMEGLTKRHPDSRLSDFTIGKIKEITGPKTGGAIYIPFNAIIAYMDAVLAFEKKDYASAAEKFASLKDKLDYAKDSSGLLEMDVYVPLVLSYRQLGKPEELQKTAKEALEKFPKNGELRRYMEKYLKEKK